MLFPPFLDKVSSPSIAIVGNDERFFMSTIGEFKSKKQTSSSSSYFCCLKEILGFMCLLHLISYVADVWSICRVPKKWIALLYFLCIYARESPDLRFVARLRKKRQSLINMQRTGD